MTTLFDSLNLRRHQHARGRYRQVEYDWMPSRSVDNPNGVLNLRWRCTLCDKYMVDYQSDRRLTITELDNLLGSQRCVMCTCALDEHFEANALEALNRAYLDEQGQCQRLARFLDITPPQSLQTEHVQAAGLLVLPSPRPVLPSTPYSRPVLRAGVLRYYLHGILFIDAPEALPDKVAKILGTAVHTAESKFGHYIRSRDPWVMLPRPVDMTLFNRRMSDVAFHRVYLASRIPADLANAPVANST